MATENYPSVSVWVKQFSDNDMPVFAGTVSRITEAVNNELTSASDLAHIALQDASLTSRLLRLANSFHFNPGKQQINTVTRAVMVLGFEQVRALTLSMILVDNLGQGKRRQKLTQEMAQAFHAAIQAQELAIKFKAASPEDIFVATLLSRLGNMAFWAFGGQRAEALLQRLETGTDAVEAEREVLGFPLVMLTRGLSKSWSLGELLDDYVNQRHNDERISFIRYGNALANASQQGWQSEEANHLLEELADSLGMQTAEISKLAFSNARKAKEITRLYGCPEAGKAVPQPTNSLIRQSNDNEADEPQEESVTNQLQTVVTGQGAYPEPDINYQITVMQEITSTVQERPSIGIVLEMVLEGLHRGVGMDRAMFAILNPERTRLSCKYVLGNCAEKLRQSLTIDITKPENIFSQIINTQKPRWLSGDPRLLGGTLSRDTLTLLGTPPYMIMPTIIRNKVIGVFMVDRNASGREMTEQDFVSFQQFCQQANMGLTFLAIQG